MADDELIPDETTDSDLETGPDPELAEEGNLGDDEMAPDEFEKVFPELSGQDVSPQVRQRLLIRELTRVQAAQASLREANDEPPSGSPGLSPQFGGYDDARIARIVEQLQDGDAAPLVECLRDMRDGHRSLTETAGQALTQIDTRVRRLSVPSEIEAVLEQVPGSAQEDIRTAAKIMADTSVSPTVALELAMHRRVATMPRNRQRDADASARRRAAGISASQRAEGGGAGGNPHFSVDATDEEIAAQMRKEMDVKGGLIRR